MAETIERGLTYDDYAKLPEGAGWELIGGALVHEPAPTTTHQTVCLNIASALRSFVRDGGLGMVFTSPTDVTLDGSETYQPDVLFVRSERRSIVTEARIIGAPDLVVEVLSPSSAYYDLRHKRDVYARSGVREYWIVDPIASSVDLLENVDGTFIARVEGRRDGTIASLVLDGFAMEITEIFRLD